jgi:hypothetical protein
MKRIGISIIELSARIAPIADVGHEPLPLRLPSQPALHLQ